MAMIIGSANRTCSPLPPESDLSRVVCSRPLVKGTKALGTTVVQNQVDMRIMSRTLICLFPPWLACVAGGILCASAFVLVAKT